MSRAEMVMRLGFYIGIAERLLGDDSYGREYRGHAELITEEVYAQVTGEIQARLVEGGHIAADEDPFPVVFVE